MTAVFGLIDGNSFYCSCERAFAPRLLAKPIVVLSNNDGRAIARSAEAKARGIRMGNPWHLIRHKPACRDVEWFSSNYALYGDMSRRMYQVLAARVPRVEPYSIDEMFLDLTGLPVDLVAFARGLRDEVRRVAKIPACVGLGPTKTIAKLANGVAKDRGELRGVCDPRDTDERARAYAELLVGEVWGIGPRTREKLERVGVKSVADFAAADPRAVRDMLTVVGGRVQAELRGVSCLPLSLMAAPRKGIAVTRSFGRAVETWSDMREAIAAHAARAGEKLRAEGLEAGRMSVFLHTNPHNGDLWHSASHGARIEPTADTVALIGEAARMLRPLWRPGFHYSKAGLMLDELAPASARPAMLFATRDPVRSAKAMAALDAVNARFGRGALRPLSTGIERPWRTQARKLSPRYTTRTEEMLTATAF